MLQAIDEMLEEEEEKETTPTHLAVEEGYEGVVNYLVQEKRDINALNAGGDTPLHIAASKENENILTTLIRGGANVNATNREQQTPLHK